MMDNTHTETNMSNGKSGFEIRADLLNQAQGILEGNIHRKIDQVHAHNDRNEDNPKVVPARQLKATDVISVAKELYEFVNEK
jgi:hypothetical protein